MTQSYQSPFAQDDALSVVMTTDLPETLETLATLFAGGSAPGAPFASQPWADTAAAILKLRTAANDGWMDIARLRDKAVKLGATQDWGTVSGAATSFVLMADEARKVLRIALVSTGSSTSSSGNEVTFDLYNVTQGHSLFSGTVGTDTALAGVGGGADFAANTPVVLTPDQNQDVAAGDVLELRLAVTGAPTVNLTRLFSQIEVF